MEDIYSGVILLIIGYPQVGKRNIAKELSKLTAMKIIDHHIIHDLIFKITNKKDGVSTKSLKHASSIRGILLDVIVDCARMEQSFILTDEFFQGNLEHKTTYQKIKTIAEKRGSIFIPVRLMCDIDEVFRKHKAQNRFNEFKTKFQTSIYKNCLSNTILSLSHPNLINIDINDMTNEECAKEIVKRMEHFL